MESAGHSLFLFSSLITTSTHCDCAETQLGGSPQGGRCLRVAALETSGCGLMRKNSRTKITLHFQSRAACLPPATRSFCCFPDCAEITMRMSLRGFVVDRRGSWKLRGCVCEIVRWH